MRLGVFLPNWVGDVVMATPALRALRQLVADGALVGVMRPYVAEVLAGASWFDDVIVYSKPSRPGRSGGQAKPRQAPSMSNPIEALRAARLDAVVLLTNSLRTGWMALRSGARERIGMVGNLRTWLLTTKVYPPRRGWRKRELPAACSYLQIAQAAGAPPVAPTLELSVTDADQRLADRAWERLALPHPGRVAVFNTGGAFGAAKDWPAEHFSALARRIARERELHVLVNCGPAERDAVRRIVAAASDPRVVGLADEPDLPIGLSKAAIRRARLLVTTDSGPRFFGVAFGVPTVTLFGPTGIAATQTFSELETTVSLGLECQPCMKRVCPLGHHRCMRDLSLERVLSAVDAALSLPRDRHRCAA